VPLLIRLIQGRLPPLGWNSWNAFGCNINETKFLTAATTLVDSGLKDAGYEYVNGRNHCSHAFYVRIHQIVSCWLFVTLVDDCWSVKDHRNPISSRLVPDPVKFPDGIDGMAVKIHAKGLKMGIYSSE
jgi:alpha-galactosidase